MVAAPFVVAFFFFPPQLGLWRAILIFWARRSGILVYFQGSSYPVRVLGLGRASLCCLFQPVLSKQLHCLLEVNPIRYRYPRSPSFQSAGPMVMSYTIIRSRAGLVALLVFALIISLASAAPIPPTASGPSPTLSPRNPSLDGKIYSSDRMSTLPLATRVSYRYLLLSLAYYLHNCRTFRLSTTLS